MNLKKALWPVVILLVAYGLSQLMLVSPQKVERQEKPEIKPTVEVTILQTEPLTLALKSQGVVTSKRAISLVSEVAGEILWVSPKLFRGGEVIEGESLLKVQPVSYELAVAEARAALAKARLNLLDEQTEFKRASRYQADNKQQDVSLRKNKLALVEAEFSAAESRLQEAQLKLEKTNITAPFNAFITEKAVDRGHFLSVGAKVANLSDSEQLEVRLPITAAQLAFLKPDTEPASVVLTGQLGHTTLQWPASLIYLERQVDPETRVFHVLAKIQSATHSLLKTPPLGLFVTAEISGISREDLFRIPVEALHDDHVFIEQQGVIKKRFVNVFRRERNTLLVDEGLDAGDRLVVSRLELMVEGMRVDVVGSRQ